MAPGGRAAEGLPTASFPQFQFVNSYLSLFYIGFYLKDMERLKEVRPQPKAVPPSGGQWGAGLGPRGPRALQPLPPLLHPSLSVRLSVCPLSACRPPICPSTCPSVPPQLLLVLSLSQSLERQLRAVLVPLAALRFRLLLLSLRGCLLMARAKVWADGEPAGPRQGGQCGCAWGLMLPEPRVHVPRGWALLMGCRWQGLSRPWAPTELLGSAASRGP